jgi:hypothetical protein
MIDQSTVVTNTIQTCLIEMLKKGIEEGYMGPAYFQPRRSPPVFPKGQSASQLIDDPTVGITPSPQINTSAHDSSSDAQPIANRNIGGEKRCKIAFPLTSNAYELGKTRPSRSMRWWEGSSGGRRGEGGRSSCDNPPRKIPYYRLNQSTLVVKQ